MNPVDQFRERYIQTYKDPSERRQIVETGKIEEIISYMSGGYRAAAVFMAKAGLRREECCRVSVGDFDFDKNILFLKKSDLTRKRSNCRIPLDDQMIREVREHWEERRARGETLQSDSPAFATERGCRLLGEKFRQQTEKAAVMAGVHHSGNDVPLCQRFTPHCFRHWMTTTLMERGMPVSYIDEIRGDIRKGSRETYHHISDERLVETFRKFSPVLKI